MMQRILVWDYPQRLGHWLLAGSFAIAYVSGEAEAWQAVHVAAGACFAALLAFRLVWGVAGSRYARFAEFVRPPRVAVDYLRALAQGHPPHSTGHNPAGAYAILALLGFGVLLVAAGFAAWQEWGGRALSHAFGEVHEGIAGVLLAVVAVHVAGVITGSILHRENLVTAMFTGRKCGPSGAGLAGPRPLAGAAVLVLAAFAVVWGFSA
ncbi:MAG: cytochrome b/b6 domain-containing protein [Rhodocyclaceae bacterium]|nr:cytochrome b/b6 domain-containing protein [Rhodocyclaceae bacterium]MBX3670049.1 cytochrome b/b6 domain-containing protein [Rhodocyclaceae bacterium]